MNVVYFQGGPRDLSKTACPDKPPNPIFVAEMVDAFRVEATAEDRAKTADCVKHVYKMVGGYTQQGVDYYTYIYDGPLSRILT